MDDQNSGIRNTFRQVWQYASLLPFRPVACLLITCLLSQSVIAQEDDSEQESERALERVTVTGTRLRTQIPEGAYPLTVVERDQILNSGQESLGDFLQELPFVSGSPLSTTTSVRGEGGGLSRGVSTLELRGLGPERTLILVNGRRFVPGGNGASGVVDLAMIPVSMVERVEIFKAGASVEYGADAVAGVINIITRSETDGLELQAQGSITSRGDAETYALSAVFGKRYDRGSFLAGIEYTDQPSLSKGDRSFSDSLLTVSGPNNTIVPDGSSAPPQGNFRTSQGRLILIDGENGDSVDDFRPFIDGGTETDRFNFNPFEDLLQASERLSVFAQGRYEFSTAFNLFGEALYHQRDSSQQLAPLPFFTNREEGVDVSADNVFNPFNETLSDVRRRLVEAGPRQFVQDNEAWRVVLGADGLLGGWFWDASINHARNSTDQLQTGDLLDSQLALALGPSFLDAGGNAVCGTPDAPINGCVPLNVFGGVGSITPAMLDFVGTDLRDSGFNEQTVFSANVTGGLFELPAGELEAAFGYEYRDEDAADVPDPQTVLGNTTGAARAITSGSFDTHEVYAEFGVPLLRDVPGAQNLTLDLGSRLVDFSNFGTEVLLEAGLHYQPVTGLQFRVSYSEAFRAPNVRELFGGFSQSNPIVQDPCADFSQLSNTEIDRCVVQGVPADGSFTQNGQETPQLGGGNPDLGPEQADTFTLGLTYQPAWLDGLVVNLDYYDIKIDNGIFALGSNTILEQCLATGEPAFCNRIQRAADGTITQVSAQLQNLASETAKGVDLDVRYSHAGLGGGFDHRVQISYIGERDLVAFPGAEPFAGAGGFDMDTFGAIPHWRGNYRIGWTGGRWRLGYEAQWIGAVDETGGEIFPGTVNEVPHQVYHDVFASYALNSAAAISAGVDNLTDESPPFFANADEANTDVGTYRLLGTTFWLRLNYRL